MENLHYQKVLIEDIPSRVACVLLSAVCAGLKWMKWKDAKMLDYEQATMKALKLIIKPHVYWVQIDMSF